MISYNPSGREFDEARRDDLTVLILNLSLKATERDVWKFFSEVCVCFLLRFVMS
jgi:hypothetical protein